MIRRRVNGKGWIILYKEHTAQKFKDDNLPRDKEADLLKQKLVSRDQMFVLILKILPAVKQCANDSMVNNALRAKEIIESDAAECGHGKSVVIHLTTVLRQFPLTQRSVLMLKYCLQNDPKYPNWKANHQYKIN